MIICQDKFTKKGVVMKIDLLQHKKVDELIYVRPFDYWKFGFSQSQFKSLINEGIIPSYLPSPKTRYIKVEDIINYIEGNKVESDE